MKWKTNHGWFGATLLAAACMTGCPGQSPHGPSDPSLPESPQSVLYGEKIKFDGQDYAKIIAYQDPELVEAAHSSKASDECAGLAGLNYGTEREASYILMPLKFVEEGDKRPGRPTEKCAPQAMRGSFYEWRPGFPWPPEPWEPPRHLPRDPKPRPAGDPERPTNPFKPSCYLKDTATPADLDPSPPGHVQCWNASPSDRGGNDTTAYTSYQCSVKQTTGSQTRWATAYNTANESDVIASCAPVACPSTTPVTCNIP